MPEADALGLICDAIVIPSQGYSEARDKAWQPAAGPLMMHAVLRERRVLVGDKSSGSGGDLAAADVKADGGASASDSDAEAGGLRDTTKDRKAKLEFDALVAELGTADTSAAFEWSRFSTYRYSNTDAVRLLRAVPMVEGAVAFIDGAVQGDLELGEGEWPDITIAGSIVGEVRILGEVKGRIGVTGEVTGDLRVFGAVSHNVWVSGILAGNVEVVNGGSVGVDVTIGATGRVEGELSVWPGGAVGATVGVLGSVASNVRIQGSVKGGLILQEGSSVRGDVGVWGEVGFVEVYGSVNGSLTVWADGQVGGDLDVLGSVDKVELRGRIGGRVTLTPQPSAVVRLWALNGAAFAGEVFVGDNVTIVDCDFRRCPDLDRLNLFGVHVLLDSDGNDAKRLTNPPAGTSERIPDNEMASVYRQLRVNLEKRSNRPGAAWFYNGEMDSRLQAAWAADRYGEWIWIVLYKVMSGYGLVVWRPIAWFLVLWAAGVAAFSARNLVLVDSGLTHLATFPQTITFTLQSMLSLFNPPDAHLGWGTTLVQVALRLVGPILAALTVLAVRDRVAR